MIFMCIRLTCLFSVSQKQLFSNLPRGLSNHWNEHLAEVDQALSGKTGDEIIETLERVRENA